MATRKINLVRQKTTFLISLFQNEPSRNQPIFRHHARQPSQHLDGESAMTTVKHVNQTKVQDFRLILFCILFGSLIYGCGSREISSPTTTTFPCVKVRDYCIGPNMDLRNADLHDSDLSGLDLSNTDLTSANLSGANLTGVVLTGAQMRFVNLQNSNLSEASIWNANLSDADLRDAIIMNTDFMGSNLSRADLLGARGTGVKESLVKFQSTRLPNGKLYTND